MEEKVKLAPHIFSYPDFEHSNLHMEISLGGGVKKEEITFKVNEGSFYIRAPQDDFEYVTSMRFCCPVRASETKAKFENGILKVTIPFRSWMDDAVQVAVA